MLWSMADEQEPLEPLESLPEVIPVEPPLVQPARPGPNIGMALLWFLGLLATQLSLGVIAAVVVMLIGQALLGREGLWNSAQDGLLLHVPGASLIYLIFGTGGTLAVGTIAVAAFYRT